ncbi:Aste57867_2603 [Aphanomyces stellatus]|uniref:Aste57867_2603 protein n=1 Tax=Aphanomyces stellatus TaxID=120398 RepID=A0A485KAF7_9STRA|nr:hypothetical protein As57867_002596 [Aphanomyces stellatus]VFT79799.1 Aste57867_2603 [Aphanomyces stellatus]
MIRVIQHQMRLTLVEKHALCTKHLSEPILSYSDLASWAVQQFGLSSTPSKATISHIIKNYNTESLRADKNKRTRETRVKLSGVEVRLVEWVLRCEELGVCITGGLIRKQANDVWHRTFGILQVMVAQIPAKTRIHVQSPAGQVLEMPTNIFNMDETSFFYSMPPYCSITRIRVPGLKTTSSTPCSLGPLSAHVAFVQDRKDLMIVDNAPKHKVDADTHLRNVSVKMLPQNTTTYLQPQDAGIFASVNAKVKQRKLQSALEQINSVIAGREDCLYEVPLDVAMGWAKDAWISVSSITVTICWARTGIIDEDLTMFSDRVANLEVNLRE